MALELGVIQPAARRTQDEPIMYDAAMGGHDTSRIAPIGEGTIVAKFHNNDILIFKPYFDFAGADLYAGVLDKGAMRIAPVQSKAYSPGSTVLVPTTYVTENFIVAITVLDEDVNGERRETLYCFLPQEVRGWTPTPAHESFKPAAFKKARITEIRDLIKLSNAEPIFAGVSAHVRLSDSVSVEDQVGAKLFRDARILSLGNGDRMAEVWNGVAWATAGLSPGPEYDFDPVTKQWKHRGG